MANDNSMSRKLDQAHKALERACEDAGEGDNECAIAQAEIALWLITEAIKIGKEP